MSYQIAFWMLLALIWVTFSITKCNKIMQLRGKNFIHLGLPCSPKMSVCPVIMYPFRITVNVKTKNRRTLISRLTLLISILKISLLFFLKLKKKLSLNSRHVFPLLVYISTLTFYFYILKRVSCSSMGSIHFYDGRVTCKLNQVAVL